MHRIASLALIALGVVAGCLALSIVEVPWRGVVPSLLTCILLGLVEVQLVRRYLGADTAIWRLDEILFPFVSLGVATALIVSP